MLEAPALPGPGPAIGPLASAPEKELADAFPFPGWQFAAGARTIEPELSRVIEAAAAAGWTDLELHRYTTTPAGASGTSPAEMLNADGADGVVALIRGDRVAELPPTAPQRRAARRAARADARGGARGRKQALAIVAINDWNRLAVGFRSPVGTYVSPTRRGKVTITMSYASHAVLGPVSAVRQQPRRRHADEVWVHAPTAPWSSRRLPRTLCAGDRRRTLFRSLLRRSEGVPVDFADGSTGVVADVRLHELGFDFWAEALDVATPVGRRRVPVDRVQRIDIRSPRIVLGR